MTFLPDLATKTPLWLALLTVGVNALVGALRASIDDEHHWGFRREVGKKVHAHTLAYES